MLYNIKINNNKFNPGCFMLYNTGKEAVTSTHGLLTTVAYQVFKRTGVREIRERHSGWRRGSFLCFGGKRRCGWPRSQVQIVKIFIWSVRELVVKPQQNNKETRWLRDNLGMIEDYAQAYELASQVDF